MNFNIENCEYKVKYKCPLEWKNLKETKDSKIRFCDECNKNVYRCKTSEDIVKHINLNNCIAVEKNDERPEPLMGDIDFPGDDEPNSQFGIIFYLLIFCGILYALFYFKIVF